MSVMPAVPSGMNARPIRNSYKTWWERRLKPVTSSLPDTEQIWQHRRVVQMQYHFEINTYDAAQNTYSIWVSTEELTDPEIWVGNPASGAGVKVPHNGDWTLRTNAQDLQTGRTIVTCDLERGNTDDDWEDITP